jgi:putative flavoprotein involved in K+ transport
MRTTAVVIGAGHAGLAMSRRLTERSIDHVVLERGEVANSWRTQRWPSLRLLTPNWLTRLPGYDYAGDDPGGYMPAARPSRAGGSAVPAGRATRLRPVRAAAGISLVQRQARLPVPPRLHQRHQPRPRSAEEHLCT